MVLMGQCLAEAAGSSEVGARGSSTILWLKQQSRLSMAGAGDCCC